MLGLICLLTNFFVSGGGRTGLNVAYDGILMVIDFSGRFNGEAFVEFVDAANANKALERHKHKISSRWVNSTEGRTDAWAGWSAGSGRSVKE